MKITCDENHVYRDESGTPIKADSVTNILQEERYIDFAGVPGYLLEAGRDFGQNLHLAIHLYNKGTLNWELLDPALIPYVEAYSRLLTDFKAEVIQTELSGYCKTWNYTWTLDLVLNRQGKLCIYDLKSGKPPKWAQLQSFAYKLAFEEFSGPKIKERGCIQLIPGKTVPYRIEPHTRKEDEGQWKSILQCHYGREKYL